MSRRNREKSKQRKKPQIVIDDPEPTVLLRAICRKCQLSWPPSMVRKRCGQCGRHLIDRRVQMEAPPQVPEIPRVKS